MPPDQWSLYSLMLKSRLLEEAVVKLWHDGLISGEMHLGTGEEAVNAGVVAHLREGDAMALDHRGTAALMMRGVDPVLILREMLGRPDGLCGGKGGHMHLFSKAHLAASSGIVGASGPAASGFALSAQYLRPGAVAVAFFGEGVMRRERESGGFRLPTQDVPGRSECRMSFSATNAADRYTLSGGHFELAELTRALTRPTDGEYDSGVFKWGVSAPGAGIRNVSGKKSFIVKPTLPKTDKETGDEVSEMPNG